MLFKSRKLLRRLVKTQSGQTLVEVALVFPVMITLLFSGVFFGFYMKDQAVVLDAARQAARTYAVSQSDSSAQQAANTTLNNVGIAAPAQDVQIQGNKSGNWVTYSVSYTDPVLPFAFGLLPVLQNLQTVTERSTFYVE